jgi:hypothetical protein
MSANGMARPCSCPARRRVLRGIGVVLPQLVKSFAMGRAKKTYDLLVDVSAVALVRGVENDARHPAHVVDSPDAVHERLGNRRRTMASGTQP